MLRCIRIYMAALGVALAACDQVPSAVPGPGPAAQLSAAASAPVITKAVFDSTYSVRVEYSDAAPPGGCCFREAILWVRSYGNEFYKVAESHTPGVVVDQRLDIRSAQDRVYRVEVVGYGTRRLSALSAPVHTEALPRPGPMTAARQDRRLVLHWVDASLLEKEFLVQRRVRADWVTIAQTPTNVNELVIDHPADSVRFRVLARAQTPTLDHWDLVNRTTFPGPEFVYSPFSPPDAAPTLVSARFTLVNYGVHVAFTYPENDSVVFVLDRRTFVNEHEWRRVPISVAVPGLFIDRDFPVTSEYTHEYRVRACHRSACRTSDSVRLQTPQLRPPYGLSAEALTWTGGVYLWWFDNSVGEQGFLIERRTPSTRYQTVATTLANQTAYLDPTPVMGQQNIYRVSALVHGNSRERTSYVSDEDGVFVPRAPPVITEAFFSYLDYGVHISFSYRGPATLRLERRLVGAADWEGVTHTQGFTDQTFRVSKQNDFEYRMSACTSGSCLKSDPVRINTPRLRAPENVAAAAASCGVRVTWTDASFGENEFVVERATSATGSLSTPDESGTDSPDENGTLRSWVTSPSVVAVQMVLIFRSHPE